MTYYIVNIGDVFTFRRESEKLLTVREMTDSIGRDFDTSDIMVCNIDMDESGGDMPSGSFVEVLPKTESTGAIIYRKLEKELGKDASEAIRRSLKNQFGTYETYDALL